MGASPRVVPGAVTVKIDPAEALKVVVSVAEDRVVSFG